MELLVCNDICSFLFPPSSSTSHVKRQEMSSLSTAQFHRWAPSVFRSFQQLAAGLRLSFRISHRCRRSAPERAESVSQLSEKQRRGNNSWLPRSHPDRDQQLRPNMQSVISRPERRVKHLQEELSNNPQSEQQEPLPSFAPDAFDRPTYLEDSGAIISLYPHKQSHHRHPRRTPRWRDIEAADYCPANSKRGGKQYRSSRSKTSSRASGINLL